jgi:hypothetical protein
MKESIDQLGRTGKSIVTLYYRGIVTASLALALGNFGFHLYAAWSKAEPAAALQTQQVQALREERLATLHKIVDLINHRYHSGSASMAELLAAKRDVGEGELEACAGQKERVRVLEKMVEDTSILEGQAAQLARKDVATEESALAIKADLLRLKIRLNQAQAESSCDSHIGHELAPGSLPLR